ncbi:MAG: glycoside hydrolase family 1 protein, partial [Acidobacteriaceae bacterium]|nr:glycoside hydrolase family 1 protein [Acidobacteriaceae bacterium]
KSGHSCESACEWWKNAERDFDLARELGLNALRLSIEWSRIEPRPGEWDESALQRYRAMLQALLDRGIRPFVTLHHFTHPLWFEHAGGFLSPHSAGLFERFTARAVAGLRDLCSDWVTINEPNVYCAMAYALGEFPPGHTGQIGAALRVLGSMARAHALAYRVIHKFQPNANVGWAQNFVVFKPAGAGFDPVIAWLQNKLFNESFIRMVHDGTAGFPLNRFTGDVSEARGTCDFVGLNVYSRFHVCFDRGNPRQFYGRMFVPADAPQGDHGVEMPYGEAYPQAIGAAIQSVRRLKKPIYILENGVPDAADRIRPWLLVNSLQETHRAIASGADVRGYFHWSLTDNFEWSEGWGLRFGLFALDEKTQSRTLRPSGRVYAQIANGNTVPQPLLEQYAEPPGNGR